jgi:hypothetical protein
MQLVVFVAVNSAFETIDLAGREFALRSETMPVCMSYDVILLPTFCNINFGGKVRPHYRQSWKLLSPTAANEHIDAVAASTPLPGREDEPIARPPIPTVPPNTRHLESKQNRDLAQ